MGGDDVRVLDDGEGMWDGSGLDADEGRHVYVCVKA